MDALKLSEGFATVFEIGNAANKYIDEKEPWALAKDENRKGELENCIHNLIETLRKIAILLKSFLIDTPNKMFEQLGTSAANQEYETINNDVVTGDKVCKKEALFNRLDVEKEVQYIDDKIAGK